MRANQQFSEHPFSWRGRFSRLSYLAWMGGMTIIAICTFAFDFFRLFKNSSQINLSVLSMDGLFGSFTLAFLPSIIFLVLSLYPAFVFVIRRLHDLNQSGWWSILIFVPVLSFILYLYLMFFKGDEKRNSYGHPRETYLWEGFLGGIVGLILIAFMMISVVAVFLPMGQAENTHLLKLVLSF
ncbi:DUF805 domain-containing protein [Acinetobacter sp. Marseille-Q1618]|uniref:DUF805 domain-containing protein n=1 Tax=Acinetobacter sp. Marseille-Q1618 TaxID=2697502 RepID=UPI00156FAFE7|nr:DUF805 domain-containing protein [Acinetobacter sp. Marseille-Q1618]